MKKEFLQELLENVTWWSLGWFALLSGLLNLTQDFWGWLSAICFLLASMVTLPIFRSWLTSKIIVLQSPKLVRKITIGAMFLLLLAVMLTPVSVDQQTTFASEARSDSTTELPIVKQSTETVPLIIKLISSLGG
jgi:hypothetical protein